MGEFYVGLEPADDPSPIALWIRFVGTARVRLSGTSDGWGIGLDEAQPTGKNMGPAGRTVIEDMARLEPFSQCMGSTLQGVAVLTSDDSPEAVGIRLSFDPGGVVLVLNWGDELVVDIRPPVDAMPDDLVVRPVEDGG
jgi:hypothetical protein